MAISTIVHEAEETVASRPFAELVEGSGLGVTISVGAGQTIVIEGDPIDHYFRLVSGSVRLYKAVADGRRQIIDFLGATDCFGLTGLEQHGYSVEAITDVVMIKYPRRRLNEAIEERPDLGQSLLRMACTELERAQHRMLLLGRKSAEERLASFLLDLAERRGDVCAEGKPLNLAMSRQDIADHLGLTIETVSRIFTRFKTSGLIDLPDRHTVIFGDVHRLASIADGVIAT